MPEVTVGTIETQQMPNMVVTAVYDSPDTLVTALHFVNPHDIDCTLDFHPQDEGFPPAMLAPARFQWSIPAQCDVMMVPPDGLRIYWSDTEHVEGNHTIYSQAYGFDPQTSTGEIFGRCHNMM